MVLHFQCHDGQSRIRSDDDVSGKELSGLCTKCKELDLDDAFSRRMHLGTRPVILTDENATCPLCRLIVDVGDKYPPRRVEKGSRVSYSIESAEYRYVVGVTEKVDRLCDGNVFCLIVYPTGLGPLSHILTARDERKYLRCAILVADDDDEGKKILDSEATGFSGRVVKRDAVDYDLVDDWLSWCHAHHPDKCFPTSETAMAGLEASNMRLIDCEHKTVRQYRAGDRYVALSYVWGSARSHLSWRPSSGARLPTPIPRGIEDAMTVCKRLNLPYLWVDQYCIDQKDPRDQERQIGLMRDIYSRSSLAIFAAAGRDPFYGLPGVSTRLKSICPEAVRLDNMTLVSSLRRPAHLIDWSSWGQRGWTYQEGELANRRLIFTDEQVSFECRGIHCVEAIRRPLQIISTETRGKLRNEVRPEYFRANFNPERRRLGITYTRTKIWQHIVAFNQRKLSNESDRLAAFSGILKKYGAYGMVSHVIGIPIDSLNFGRKEKWSRSGRMSKASEHEVSFIAALCWHTNGIRCQKRIVPQQRRHALPSFSWIGWTGPINFELIRNAFGKAGGLGGGDKFYQALARFEDFKTNRWRLASFSENARNGLSCIGRTTKIWLRLTVPDVNIALLHIQSGADSADPSHQLEFPRESFRLSSPMLGREYNKSRGSDSPADYIMIDGCYNCLKLMNYGRMGVLKKTYLLLFERHRGYVERIGLLELMDHQNHLGKLAKWPTKTESLILR